MDDLLYDWNATPAAPGGFDWTRAGVHVQDETLRDGAQSVSVTEPRLDEKKALLHHTAGLGVHSVAIGFPAMSARAAAHVLALAREIAEARLPLSATCAARTLPEDVHAITDASQSAGLAIEVATFIGTSRIRQVVEGWTLDDMCRRIDATVSAAVQAGHAVMFVAEDATRAEPNALATILGAALRAGATRLCLADTVGGATPDGVRRLVAFVREVVGPNRAVDWHGHRDRGLGLANCLTAIEAGVNRVHATALGLGERVGNVEMELLLVNLALLGAHHSPLTGLAEYSRLAARAFDVAIPPGYPVVGADAFTTGAGTHASALLKARALADQLYSAYAPGMIGRRLEVRVTPASGASNVRWWLAERGYDASDGQLMAYILAGAKAADRAIDNVEIEMLRADYLSSTAPQDARTAPPAARA
jgi:isopropylmalate/homocitrate/citramalate synthase